MLQRVSFETEERKERERPHGDGERGVEAIKDTRHDEEKTEVNVHRKLGEMATKRRNLLVRGERLDLDKSADGSSDVGRSGRVKGFEERFLDALSSDLHDFDAEGEVLEGETGHLGLRVFLHLYGRRTRGKRGIVKERTGEKRT